MSNYQKTKHTGIYERNGRYFIHAKTSDGKRWVWLDVNQNLTEWRKAREDTNTGKPTQEELCLIYQAVAAIGSLVINEGANLGPIPKAGAV